MDNFGKRQEEKYKAALQRCTSVAREEYEHAQKALAEAEKLIQKLRRGMKTVRVGAQAGPTVQNAQAALADLNRRLDGIVTEQLVATSASLATKKACLEKFTVTLFGRTMAGKSTIREALTYGDGGTIGKGNQRTTRDIQEYEWNHLRIVDTPGIGAYEGKADSEIAKSAINESDILLFLVSSDSIQESSFHAMQTLRDQNKPIIFVLNVKYDLTQPVYRRRFLKSSYSVMGKEALAGHLSRIRKLASGELGMRNVTIIQVHAQAAFLATRPEYAAQCVALHRASGMDDLLEKLTDEVLQRSPVRRLQTLLDGTIIQIMDLEKSLRQKAKNLNSEANYLKNKFAELNEWLDGYIGDIDERINRRISEIYRPLRDSVSTFIDENLEKPDVEALWERHVESEKEKIEKKIGELCGELRNKVQEHLQGFNKQLASEFELLRKINMEGPEQYDPLDIKRIIEWASNLLLLVPGLGWITRMLMTAVSKVLTWFMPDREGKLQRRKNEESRQLRNQIESNSRDTAKEIKRWFDKEIVNKLIQGTRRDALLLYEGMFKISKGFGDAVSSCAKLQADLNRWLLLRCGRLVGERVAKDAVSAWIARDPGTQTKCIGTASSSFCRKVGKALGERVEVQKPGSMQEMIAEALRPATVDPVKISFDQDGAIVRLSRNQLSRAKGRDGANLRLAECLLKTPIRLREDKGAKS